MPFREAKVVLFSADLAGYTRAVASLNALAVAAFLDEWYRQCADAVRSRGGRVVKYMGDACFATFPEDKAADAVTSATALQDAIGDLRARHQVRIEIAPTSIWPSWRKASSDRTTTAAMTFWAEA